MLACLLLALVPATMGESITWSQLVGQRTCCYGGGAFTLSAGDVNPTVAYDIVNANGVIVDSGTCALGAGTWAFESNPLASGHLYTVSVTLYWWDSQYQYHSLDAPDKTVWVGASLTEKGTNP